MKKAMKKLMAALLAVAMVCAMAIPAFAAEGGASATTGTITVDNAVNNKAYKFYRIMDIATHTDDAPYTGVVYKVNDKWSAFVKDSKWNNYFTVNADNTVTVANDTVDNSIFAEKFAAEAQKVLTTILLIIPLLPKMVRLKSLPTLATIWSSPTVGMPRNPLSALWAPPLPM